MNLRTLLIVLLCLTLPLWLFAGFGDWLCHRHTRIDRTSGARESALHLLLHLLIAVPLGFALFLEITALMQVFMAAAVIAHMGVSLWDTSVAQPRRYIAPLEQQIHSYLEMLPLFAMALVVVLHWDALANPAWSLSVRDPPLPAAWTWGVLLALAAGLSLILEEWWRCRRAARNVG